MDMTVYDRLYSVGKRIRYTVLFMSLFFVVGGSSAFHWHVQVFEALLAPAGGKLSPFEGGKPVYSAIQDMFGSTLAMSYTMAKLSALPVLIVGALSLMKPMAPEHWWRWLVGYSVSIISLWVIGDVFVYYVMLPVSVNFLLQWGEEVATPVILLTSYLELLFSLLKWIGLIFTVPAFMHMFARFGWLSYKRVKGVWRIALPTSAIFSAIISPGLDGFVTLLVFLTMYSLYLLGLGLVWSTDTSQGNYLWFWTIRRFLGRGWHIVTAPVRGVRRVHNKFRDNNKRMPL